MQDLQTLRAFVTVAREGSVSGAAEKALAAVAAFDHSAGALHSTLRGRLKIGTIVDPEFIRLGAFLHRLVEHR